MLGIDKDPCQCYPTIDKNHCQLDLESCQERRPAYAVV